MNFTYSQHYPLHPNHLDLHTGYSREHFLENSLILRDPCYFPGYIIRYGLFIIYLYAIPAESILDFNCVFSADNSLTAFINAQRIGSVLTVLAP